MNYKNINWAQYQHPPLRKFSLLNSDEDLQNLLLAQRLGDATYTDDKPREFPCMASVDDISWRSHLNSYKIFLSYIYPEDVFPLLTQLVKNNLKRFFPKNKEF